MQVVADPAEFHRLCRGWAAAAGGLGLVPTMGALHAGHLSLVRASRGRDAATAASIFVNPLQFGPGEDFARYPRALERDCALLEREGVTAVFTPAAEAMYPADFATAVEVAGLSERLCGASRPGHFRGVATVVLKLFLLAQPARAYFGQKDAAQVAVIRRMVRDLAAPVEIVVCPIVREPDGLAMSSRNAYLDAAARRHALALYRSLSVMRDRYQAGERDPARLLAAGRAVLEAEPGVRPDYVAAVDPDSLLPVAAAGPGTLLAVAAFVGPARLIDNLLL
ncbi:MAG TPA: pantoate--beta-alanine ligase [Terriglobales bacterium]|nr:pantoate--beta-alanine ligase [Terriglobales bacterium]